MPLAWTESDVGAVVERLQWLRKHINFDTVIDVGSQESTPFLDTAFSDLHCYKFDKDPKYKAPVTVVELGVDCSLDSLLENEKFNSAFYKIDVDGSELDILEGSAHTLNRTSAVMIECILDDNRFYERCVWMNLNGWRLIDVIDPTYRAKGMLIQVDLIFVRPSVFEKIEQSNYEKG